MSAEALTTERLRAEIVGNARKSAVGEYQALSAGIRTEDGDVLFGVDGDGHLHLLMPMPAGGAVLEDRRSEGVQVVRHELIEQGGRQVYADLVCSKPHLHGTFHLLAEEVLGGLKDSKERPDRLAIAVIGRWRELLDRAPRPPLGLERLAGLFGELTVLLEVAERSRLALQLWAGPRAQRHDFMSASCSVEVKTSMSAAKRIQVNGLDQLVPPDGGHLYLRFFRVEEASGSPTVPELIGRLVSVGVDRRDLLALLKEVDYDVAHEVEYCRHGFRVVDRKTYRVADGFPRVTSNSFVGGVLPDGVEALSYTVNLEFAGRFELEPTEWDSVVQALAAGL